MLIIKIKTPEKSGATWVGGVELLWLRSRGAALDREVSSRFGTGALIVDTVN